MPEPGGATDRAEFERLVRDALADLYDPVALQISPLAALLVNESGDRRTRAELLREAIVAAIEQLRPAQKTPANDVPEWRSYLLLTGRYVEGESVQALQARLALSGRQLRREHSRALEALTGVLWDQATRAGNGALTEAPPAPDFALNIRPLKPLEVLQGVAATLRHRAEREDVRLHLPAAETAARILADRIVLRQILLTLLNLAFDLSEDGEVRVDFEGGRPTSDVIVAFRLEDPALLGEPRAAEMLANAALWAERIHGGLEQPTATRPGSVTLRLTLPRAEQPLVFVVDDQEIALQLYERYLSRSGVRFAGLRHAADVLPQARHAQPQAIILDVMMPDMDGWEVLQLLRADAHTRDIPVIMCSVWEEPELALSLGAADFLKKPITQKDLLAALARLRLLESAGE